MPGMPKLSLRESRGIFSGIEVIISHICSRNSGWNVEKHKLAPGGLFKMPKNFKAVVI